MKIYKLKDKEKGRDLLILNINSTTITFGHHYGYPKPMNGLLLDSTSQVYWNLSYNDKDVGFNRVKDDVLIKGCQYISGKLGDLRSHLHGSLMNSIMFFSDDQYFLGIISEHENKKSISIIFDHKGETMLYLLSKNTDPIFEMEIVSGNSVKKICEDYGFEVHTDLKIKNKNKVQEYTI